MFEEFVKKISQEIRRGLPGFSAQKRMAPLGRKQTIDYLKKGIIPKKSSVLILLYPQAIPFCVKTALILRPENERGDHAGQISFPGGSFDNTDRDLSETALREAEEEIGVDRKSITLLGELSPLYIPVSNFMVQPFIGAVRDTPQFKIRPSEVTELIEMDIDEFLSKKNKRTTERFIKTNRTNTKVPCYEINGKTIWGATAMIISEFAEIIGRIK